MKTESFDAAHRGRCPGCDMFDNGSHIGHRTASLDMGWFCFQHGDWAKATVKKTMTAANMKRESYEVTAAPDANCKTCVGSIKRVARFQKILAGVAI